MKQQTKTGKDIVISVAAAEGNEYRDVKVLPGTQPRDVLKKLGLSGFYLKQPDGSEFAMTDDLYEAVEENQKVIAVKGRAEAGLS